MVAKIFTWAAKSWNCHVHTANHFPCLEAPVNEVAVTEASNILNEVKSLSQWYPECALFAFPA